MSAELPPVLEFLVRQVAERRTGWAGDLFPVASADCIASAERELELELPPLLKRIYLEIGNGGQKLGPGLGLVGLRGGHGEGDRFPGTVVTGTLGLRKQFRWWAKEVVICDWGCCQASCVDCDDPDFTVYRYDGNAYRSKRDDRDPNDDLWMIEADSLEEWLLTPNRA